MPSKDKDKRNAITRRWRLKHKETQAAYRRTPEGWAEYMKGNR